MAASLRTDHGRLAATMLRLSAEFPTLNEADVWAMPNAFLPATITGSTRGGPCDRCYVRWSATDKSFYCDTCAPIVTRQRSSRAARAARAAKPKPGSSGQSAEPRTISHPLMDHRRIPKEHLWLVLGEGNDGKSGPNLAGSLPMRRIDMLSKAQRIVVVVALGLALQALGSYLVTLGSGLASGWYAYSPLSGGGFAPFGAAGLRPWLRLIVWLVLISVWALASARVLRPSGEDQSGSSSPEGPAAP